MVAIKDIQAANAQLTEHTAPRVAVFGGGTSGIAKATAKRLVSLGFPIKIYLIARSASESSIAAFGQELRMINDKAEVVFLPGEISLLSEVRRTSLEILKDESSIDLLFLAAGYAPFSGRDNTSEGLDVTHSLEYYGRMLFVQHLLPLLRQSTRQPRVVTVLAGFFISKGFNGDDCNLERPGAFGGAASQSHMSAMNTLTLDRLASDPENSRITFIHNWPGLVETGNSTRHWTRSWTSPFSLMILTKPLFWAIGFSIEESGERHVFISTSSSYGGGTGPAVPGFVAKNTAGGVDGGLFLLNHKCEAGFSRASFEQVKAQSADKVWAKTREILDPYL